MVLSVADVDRWNAEAVREVFHAAVARSRSAFGASRKLASLSQFATWQGTTRDAAAQQNAAIRQDLDAYGNEALAVALAARKAADEIEKVKADLTKLRADAAGADLEVGAASGQMMAIAESRYTAAEWARMREWRTELQTRLNAIVAEANSVDRQLAAAITMADGDVACAQQAVTAPLPQDPKQFNDLWNSLTPQEKDRLYSRDHNIGNHPGCLGIQRITGAGTTTTGFICPNFTNGRKPTLTACNTASTNWCGRFTWVIAVNPLATNSRRSRRNCWWPDTASTGTGRCRPT
jgi:hypothetical protein